MISANIQLPRLETDANNHMHSDKIKLRRFALQLYFAGDVVR